MPSSNILAEEKRPAAHPLLALLELPSAVIDIIALNAARPILRRAPKGDKHAVMVIPGFLGSDAYNKTLCKFLTRLGYASSGWTLGRNLGPQNGVIEALEARLLAQYTASGGKVSLIGHSLGGLYARVLAQRNPHLVRQVISLGSPISESPDSGKAVAKLFKFLNGPPDPVLRATLKIAPPMPTTAVYSHSDGIVHWRNALQRNGHAQCQNIAVYGSHSGLTVNATVWWLLADRLAQAEGQWRKFEPSGSARRLYPICQNQLATAEATT
jgi:pimeloyl-ACP methyl ester carboxylesterase